MKNVNIDTPKKAVVKLSGKSRMQFNKPQAQKDRFVLEGVGISYAGGAESVKESYLKKIVPDFDLLSFQSALRTTNVPANVAPNPETTLTVPFRLISATMVGGGTWKATDFTNETVLRAGVALLVGKPVYSEHNACPDNWLGKVERTVWTNAFMQAGVNIPAGIDGILGIDTSTDRGEDIGKGVASDVLVSNSVSVEFEWEFSHAIASEDDLYDMFWRIGEIASDGRMYCRVVTRIVDFYETSIVSLGADPYAKKINGEGNLMMVDKAGAEISQAAVSAMENGARASFCKTFSGATQFVSSDKAQLAMNLQLSKRYIKKADLAAGDGTADTTEEIVTVAPVGKMITFMEERIAMLLEKKTHENRSAVIDALADACDCSPRTVRNYLNGTTKCPPMESLVAMSSILLCASTDLVAFANQDGCNYTAAVTTTPISVAGIDAVKTDSTDVSLNKVDIVETEGATVVDAAKTDAAKTDAGCGEDEDEEEDMSKEDLSKTDATDTVDASKTDAEKVNVVDTGADKTDLSAAVVVDTKVEASTEVVKLQSDLGKVQAELDSYKKMVTDLQGNIAMLQDKAQRNTTTLSSALQTASTDLSKAKAELEQTEPMVTLGKEHFAALKAEVMRLYNAFTGAEGSEQIRGLIEKANFAKVTDVEWLKNAVVLYGGKLANLLPAATCKKCGHSELIAKSVDKDPLVTKPSGENKDSAASTSQSVTYRDQTYTRERNK